jgi:hypothetical protein
MAKIIARNRRSRRSAAACGEAAADAGQADDAGDEPRRGADGDELHHLLAEPDRARSIDQNSSTTAPTIRAPAPPAADQAVGQRGEQHDGDGRRDAGGGRAERRIARTSMAIIRISGAAM